MTGVLVKRGYLDTDINTEKMLCEDEGRDQGDGYIKMKMFYSTTDTIKMMKR